MALKSLVQKISGRGLTGWGSSVSIPNLNPDTSPETDVLIRLNNHELLIRCDQPEQRNALVQALTVTEENYSTGIPNTLCLANAIDHWTVSVPAGLQDYISKLAEKEGWSVGYVDDRRQPTFKNRYPDAELNFEPLPDQLHAVEIMVQNGRGVCSLPTNYGKTYLLALFFWRVNFISGIITVPTKYLMHQTADTLEELWSLKKGSVGRLGDGIKSIKPITVAVENSAHMLRDHLEEEDFEVYIRDEGHMRTSKTAWDLNESLKSAYYRFSLSGTPWRSLQPQHVMSLVGLAGKQLVNATNKDMVRVGRSAQPVITFLDVNKDGSEDCDGGLHSQYSYMTRHPARNKAIQDICSMAAARDLVTVVMCDTKKHQIELKKLIPDAAIVNSAEDDSWVKDALESGKLKVVLATSKWRAGVSIPRLDVGINAAGKKAHDALLQFFGRPLRRKVGRPNVCYFVDFNDKWAKYPRRHSKERFKVLSEEGFPILETGLENLSSVLREVDYAV